MGQVPPSAISDEVAGARAVVVPSITPETFGRTAAEALAHGRPVVTTGLGGLGEVVDGGSGWVTGTEVGALAGALREAATDDAAVTARGAHGQAAAPAPVQPRGHDRPLLLALYDRVKG